MKFPKLGKASEKSGAKAPSKGKALKIARGSKFVLFIGDEGSILVHIKGNVVQSRHFVPDASDQNLGELRDVLADDPKAPIMLVIDSMDQSYVQQTLPPVSSLSVGKLIKRRLDRDFGTNDIKGAIILGREETGRKDWNFMMVALETSAALTKWLEFIGDLSNRFLGIHLVSVEAELIVKYLDHAMDAPGGAAPAEWKFFVSHNKVGGFRQVILRNGRIIFTRMAQPIGESTPEVIAGNIEQEMLSTIEYMRRLSFNPQSGLDIYIVASSAIKPVIDKSKFGTANVAILSPYEVAQYLGIEGATQPTDQFGDVILAAAIGCSRKHILTLSTPQSKSFDNLYTIMLYQRMAAAAILLGTLGYTGSLGYDIYVAYSNKEDLERKNTTQQHGLDQLRADIKNTDMDVEKANDLIDLYKLMQDQRTSPVPFVAKLETVLKPPIVVKDMEWVLIDNSGGKPNMSALITLEFPTVQTLEAYRVVSKGVLEDLKKIFDGYTIEFTKIPPIFSENEKVDIMFDNGKPSIQQAGGSLDVQLTIKGEAYTTPPIQLK